jgi:NADH-quinone oxidoreductase subunit D
VLRASGVDFDLRKREPYSIYPRFEFNSVTAKTGDCFARYQVRVQEMRESVKILRQALAKIPGGPYCAPEIGERAKQNRVKPPKGEVYTRIEQARGELGVLLVSDGSNKPYRVKWRAPSFSNLCVLSKVAPGLKIPDLIATLGSIDITLGDIDR